MHIKRKILAILVLAALAATAGAQNAFTGHLDSFLEDINRSMPDNAVSGGTWSDGYIGQLISAPPHLGLGVSLGVSRFPFANLASAASAAGASIGSFLLDFGGGFLINPAIELRIGGFKLPFDLGVRFSMLASDKWYDIDLNYRTISVDLRYAIIKEHIALPDVVVGIGWYHTSGSIGYNFNAADLASNAGFSLTDMTGTRKLGIDFKTNVFEARAQVSKSLLVFTPYLGITGYYAISESSYEIAGETNERKDDKLFGSRIYGGVSFNIFMVKIDLSASYNFVTQNWGGNLGARFQL